MHKYVLIFCLFLLCPLTLCKSVYIVIHGTWGADNTWYTPGGDFFDALQNNLFHSNCTVVPFRWSGSHCHEERKRAAHSLIKLIESYTNNTIEVNIIAHSHGGTVALLACQELKNNSINLLYTLGMPINLNLYPNMNVINHYYNLFSFEDFIQPVLGIFEREHISHERIANIRVIIEGKEPNHTDLHHEFIGKWLPKIDTICASYLDKNKKNMSDPGIIYIYNTIPPTYEIDLEREKLLKEYNQQSALILSSLRQSLEMGSRIPLTNR